MRAFRCACWVVGGLAIGTVSLLAIGLVKPAPLGGTLAFVGILAAIEMARRAEQAW